MNWIVVQYNALMWHFICAASQPKSRRINQPVDIPEPTKSAQVNKGTPGEFYVMAMHPIIDHFINLF